jgi:hypothetical protein
VQTPSKADVWPALWVIGTITSHRAETDRSTPKDRSPQSPTCVPRQSRDPFFLANRCVETMAFAQAFHQHTPGDLAALAYQRLLRHAAVNTS